MICVRPAHVPGVASAAPNRQPAGFRADHNINLLIALVYGQPPHYE